MVKVKEDLTGKKFGRLTVIEQVEDYIGKNGNHIAQWSCLGSYENFEDVVCVRKEAEEKYFGKYSYDNSIGDKENDLS